jgi:hypothetical protein
MTDVVDRPELDAGFDRPARPAVDGSSGEAASPAIGFIEPTPCDDRCPYCWGPESD